ncbi:MAG: hypothetical protein CVU38_17390 [Chloroflexi bacterium HGW-Chloroflexi-1]|nr:MAG: hypothetical protein CVU38_17390 [Chloroflexi bacterium HGW-Chloroflexi-1]
MHAEPRTFNLKTFQCSLLRLDDNAYRRLRQHSIPISENHALYWELEFPLQREPSKKDERLSLPKAYVALKTLFGESGGDFDDWKGSFAFPFFLKVARGDQDFAYLLNVHDHRCSIEFDIYKLAPPDAGYDSRRYYEPFEEEFARAEIDHFIVYFYGFLVGFFDAVKDRHDEPFCKQVGSQSVLYGYQDGQFFEEQYDSEEEYQATLKTFEARYRTSALPSPAELMDEVLARRAERLRMVEHLVAALDQDLLQETTIVRRLMDASWRAGFRAGGGAERR